jgi:hypothetical protein
MPPTDPPAPESYPTFWSAIPVDPTAAPAPPATTRSDDAYVAFLDASESTGSGRLNVEQTDPG